MSTDLRYREKDDPPAMALAIAALLPGLLAAAIPTNDVSGSIAKLPDVNAILGKASGKAQEFAAQATEMQLRLASEQQKHKAAMAKQKLKFETKLSVQAAMNQNISDENARIRSNISDLQEHNAEVEKMAAFIQTQNADMRKIITTISGSVGMAISFLADSLEETDDTDAEALKVLVPTTPKPTLEHFMRVAGYPGLGSSLLQVRTGLAARAEGKLTTKMRVARRKQQHQDPAAEDLVKVLSDSLVDISAAEHEAVATLKASFMEKFSAGEKYTSALLEEQRALNETQSQLLARKDELNKAKMHLVATRTKYAASFDGLRKFASKIDRTSQEALEVDAKEFNGTLTRASPTPAFATITTTTTSLTTSSTTTAAATSTAAVVTSKAGARSVAQAPAAGRPAKSSSALAVAQASSTTTSHPAISVSRNASLEQLAQRVPSSWPGSAVASALSSVSGPFLGRAAKKAAAKATAELQALSGSHTAAKATPHAAPGHTAGKASAGSVHPEKPAARPAGPKQAHAARRQAAPAAAVKEEKPANAGHHAKEAASSTTAQAEKPVTKAPGTKEAPVKKVEHAAARPVRHPQSHVGALMETASSSEPKAKESEQGIISNTLKSWFSSWR